MATGSNMKSDQQITLLWMLDANADALECLKAGLEKGLGEES